MSVKYTYSISGDFPNQKVVVSNLSDEIHASSIVTALDYVNSSGPTCDIWFRSELSPADVATLSSVVASHDGVEDLDLESLPRRAEDNFLWVAINNFPRGTRQQLTGYGDNIANGTRGNGPKFKITGDTVGDHSVEWQFKDLRYIIGGTCEANIDTVDDDDTISFSLHAAGTSSTATPGAGNCNKYEVIPSSGMHIYVPTPSGGAVTVDLSAKRNANVNFTAAVPVPNATQSGWFNYNPLTDALTPNYTQNGQYDLYDFENSLGYFVHKIPVIRTGPMVLQVDNIVSTPVLPHWNYRVTYARAAASDFVVRWWVATGSYDIRVP